jgi:hypothetical protein
MEAANKRSRDAAERLEEELNKGTLRLNINGHSVTINELNDMVSDGKRVPWLRAGFWDTTEECSGNGGKGGCHPVGGGVSGLGCNDSCFPGSGPFSISPSHSIHGRVKRLESGYSHLYVAKSMVLIRGGATVRSVSSQT